MNYFDDDDDKNTYFAKSVIISVIGVKEVLVAQELVRSITSGDCRRLEESSPAVAVTNATFVWQHSSNNYFTVEDAGLLRVLVLQR